MTPAPQDDPWVAVAVFQRPHGLKGQVRLRPLTRDPEDLLAGPVRNFHVRQNGRIVADLTMVEGEVRQGLVYAFFEEIPDRTAAERFTNADLVIAEEDLWEPQDGGHYVFQLEGLEARDAATGERLGTVRTAREGAAHDFLVLDLLAAPGRDTLLPLIPDFVPRIDVKGGFVEVAIPEGLVD